MCRILLTVALACLLAAGCQPVAAQSTAITEFPDSTLDRLTSRLADEANIRILTKWGPFELEEPSLAATSVDYRRFLRDVGGVLPDSVAVPKPVPVDWFVALQVRDRNRFKVAATGAVAFGFAGFLFGALDSGGPHGEGSPQNRRAGVSPVTGAVLFAAVGAVLSVVASSVRSSWKTVFQQPGPTF
jgi:hypothetical protein